MCTDDHEVHFVRNGNFTIAFGEFYDTEFGTIHSAGAAKRNPSDKFDEVRGMNIALAKAYMNLGEQLLEWETDLIACENDCEIGGNNA
jgi:hypothetical protein